MKSVAVTAHRGSSATAPENTRAAFLQAITDGADYIELDVQSCADGAVVVIHDSNLMRVSGKPHQIKNLTLDEIRRMDVGSWFSVRFKGQLIPTLEETIDIVRGKVRLNVELKYNRTDPNLTKLVIKTLRNNRFLDQCVVTSSNADALQEIRQLEPATSTGLVLSQEPSCVSEVRKEILSIKAEHCTSALVRAAHQARKEVHVWTVNEPETIQHMIQIGVDNIITDNPTLAREILKHR